MSTRNLPSIVSAQVVLEDAESHDDALESALRTAGFATGPPFGGSFSIAAPVELFEQYFGVRLVPGAAGASSVAIEGRPELELPLAAMPPELRLRTKRVLFTKLPDFGPGNP
jgi:hypothetical protein